MQRNIVFLFLFFVVATPVLAQIYDDRYDDMVSPVERAIERADAVYGNVPIPGASEDDKSDAERYEESQVPFDAANERHFINANDILLLNANQPKS